MDDEAAILARAKMLAQQDGFAWENPGGSGERSAPIKPRPHLTDEQREQYLERARADLQSQADRAGFDLAS
jgi:hypothetical protein